MLAPSKTIKRTFWHWIRRRCWYQVVLRSDNGMFWRWFLVGSVIGVGLFWAILAAAAVIL